MNTAKNVLIIGACGGVGRALLKTLAGDRGRMGKLVLVDRKDPWADDLGLPFRALNFELLIENIDADARQNDYLGLLEEYRIDIAIDLSVNGTRTMLAAADQAGVSYINAGIANRPEESFCEVVLDLVNRKTTPWNAPHILCSGMNPGIVNMWVRRCIEKCGVPKSIVHFEYDTGQALGGGVPIIAWSLETLLDEIVNDPAGYVEGRNRIRLIQPNPLKNRVSMEQVLRPIMNLPVYPRGFLLLHEENITIGHEYDVPSRFLFSLKTETMDYIEGVYDENKDVPLGTLSLGDNRKIMLEGEATVGVCIEYEDTLRYFFNTTAQGAVPGVSGSCVQVAAGLNAALRTMLDDPLENRLYFVEDLLATGCERLMLDNLPVQRVVIKK